MDKDTVIKVENLSKKFCRSLKRSMFYGSLDVAKNMFGIKVNTGKLRKDEFWALENVNFEIKKGETFGLIGANGSGKTTLLRMITGIFPPDKGKIAVKGRIGALIAVGAGFHPHMTGRENIFLNGAILGMSRENIDRNMDDIINFAEIGNFLDAPVSTYSSGMTVRLGFAIAIHSLPDIVLVDEILAVGDAKFQRKCLDKIREMRKKGVTFILVSHNMQNIEAMCDRTLLLHHGKQIMIGSPQEVVPAYELMLQTGGNLQRNTDAVANKSHQNNELKLIYKYGDFGTEEISVEKIAVYNDDTNKNQDIWSDKGMIVKVNISSRISAKNLTLYATFNFVGDHKDEEKNFCSLALRKKFDIESGKSTLRLSFDMVQLTTGEYKIGIFIFDETFSNPYSQGYYGYFLVKSLIPTMLRVGTGTPFCWSNPNIEIIR